MPRTWAASLSDEIERTPLRDASTRLTDVYDGSNTPNFGVHSTPAAYALITPPWVTAAIVPPGWAAMTDSTALDGITPEGLDIDAVVLAPPALDHRPPTGVVGGSQLLHGHVPGRVPVELGQTVCDDGHETVGGRQRRRGLLRPPQWTGHDRGQGLVGQRDGQGIRLPSPNGAEVGVGRPRAAIDPFGQGVAYQQQFHPASLHRND